LAGFGRLGEGEGSVLFIIIGGFMDIDVGMWNGMEIYWIGM